MKFKLLASVALLALLPLASANAAADKVTVTRQINAALMQWLKAANRDEWKTALQLWSPELVGWYNSDNIDTYAIEAALVDKPPARHTTYTLQKINEVMVEGTLAIVRDTWLRRIEQVDGSKPLVRVRRYEVWRQQPDKQWKIIRYIESPPAPAPEIPAIHHDSDPSQRH